MSRQVLSIILILFAVAKSRAQNNTTATSQNEIPAIQKPNAISYSVDLSASSNLVREELSDSDRNSSLSLILGYKKLSAIVGVTQQVSGTQDFYLENTSISFQGPSWTLENMNNLGTSITAVLPTNEEAHRVGSYRGSLGARLSYSTQTTLWGKVLSFGPYADGMRNFHKFSRNSLGIANLQERARLGLSSQLKIHTKLNLRVLAYYQAGRTYFGDLRTAFNISEEVEWKLREKSFLYFSHSNSGSALAANGINSNVELIDGDSSVLSAGVRHQF